MEVPIRKLLGEAIREARLNIQIDRSKAAKKANIHKASWSKIENGYVWPSPKMLLGISSALDMSLSELIYRFGEVLEQCEETNDINC